MLVSADGETKLRALDEDVKKILRKIAAGVV